MQQKIKLLVFDLDGVLVDSRQIHYIALNKALETIDPKFIINYDEHLGKYDGLPTTKKLELLTSEKGLLTTDYDKVWKLKQTFTFDVIKQEIKSDSRLIEIFKQLKSDGYLIYCASNSIWNTIKQILLQKGILEYFDFFISNEEIKHAKPFPEIYLKCIERAKISSTECLIFEDSPVGRKAAYASGAHVCPIEDPDDLTLKKIIKYINSSELENNQTLVKSDLRWKKPINIVIPMAGLGSRFSSAGYAFPKPLIEVNGKPMIQLVVENLNIDGKYIYIVQKSHFEKYNLKYLLNNITPNCEIIQIESVTEGAACTVLLAEKFIDSDIPLLIANSDQYLEWNSNDFLYCAESEGIDACISTFYNTHPKWSYAKLDTNGYVIEVQEKKPISTCATTGIYYWARGSDYTKYCKQMIASNVRVNGEFYVCPVYNEAIKDDKKIKVKECKAMWGIGTPEDLNYFLDNYRN
jgi:HAD superfamily hydrolase (TIGR01509 family)